MIIRCVECKRRCPDDLLCEHLICVHCRLDNPCQEHGDPDAPRAGDAQAGKERT